MSETAAVYEARQPGRDEAIAHYQGIGLPYWLAAVLVDHEAHADAEAVMLRARAERLAADVELARLVRGLPEHCYLEKLGDLSWQVYRRTGPASEILGDGNEPEDALNEAEADGLNEALAE